MAGEYQQASVSVELKVEKLFCITNAGRSMKEADTEIPHEREM